MHPVDEGEMSLIGHLTELRKRLFVGLGALLVMTLLAFFFARSALTLLTAPILTLRPEPTRVDELRLSVAPDGAIKADNLAALKDPSKITLRGLTLVLKADPAHGRPRDMELTIGQQHSERLRYTSPIDPFMMQVKVALILGIFLALPIMLFQAWRFVAPGLKPVERRVVRPLLFGAQVMFPIGAAFAYFVVRMLLHAMQAYQVDTIEPFYDASKYMSLLTTLMLLFGAIFEMPLLMATAAKAGLIRPQALSHYRRHAYVGLALMAAALTPPDAISMLVCLGPMFLLYEVSILLCRMLAPAPKGEDDASGAEAASEDVADGQ
jgi:sec-independent protein translocase protein TatC